MKNLGQVAQRALGVWESNGDQNDALSLAIDLVSRVCVNGNITFNSSITIEDCLCAIELSSNSLPQNTIIKDKLRIPKDSVFKLTFKDETHLICAHTCIGNGTEAKNFLFKVNLEGSSISLLEYRLDNDNKLVKSGDYRNFLNKVTQFRQTSDIAKVEFATAPGLEA